MADLTQEQEASARRIAEATGMDLPSAQEAVAISVGLIPGCVDVLEDE